MLFFPKVDPFSILSTLYSILMIYLFMFVPVPHFSLEKLNHINYIKLRN